MRNSILLMIAALGLVLVCVGFSAVRIKKDKARRANVTSKTELVFSAPRLGNVYLVEIKGNKYLIAECYQGISITEFNEKK